MEKFRTPLGHAQVQQFYVVYNTSALWNGLPARIEAATFVKLSFAQQGKLHEQY
jgi:hypothetical protein